MPNTPRVQIVLSALTDNLEKVRALCPTAQIMAIVKADAYGHGLLPATMALQGADGFGVARLQEALRLREAGITHRILLLATLLDAADLELCSAQNIDVTAHDSVSVGRIAAAARRVPLRVWLELDSGMHRTGLSVEEFGRAEELLTSLPAITELVLMTHLSNADDPNSVATDRQVECFAASRPTSSKSNVSIANSAALISRHDLRGGWIRPGIILYGDAPINSKCLALRPAMTLTAPVIALRKITDGESVGYGGRWTSARPAWIATLGIGYGDGYPRHAQDGTPVWLNGEIAPIAGRVSMDSLTVDVSECANVSVGDEAVLWGPQLPVSRVAKWCDTISYALFSCLSARVQREYIDGVPEQ
jgi:alanine racemase